MKGNRIKKTSILALSCAVALSGSVPVYAATTKAPSVKTMANQEYKELNKFRTKKKVWYWAKDNKTKVRFNTGKYDKLKKLKKDSALTKTAQKRAKEISKSFSHTRPNGSFCFTAYPKNFYAMGENIAYGPDGMIGGVFSEKIYLGPKRVQKLWEEADYKYEGQGHRRNMLSPIYNRVGVACYHKNGSYYWVQSFGYR